MCGVKILFLIVVIFTFINGYGCRFSRSGAVRSKFRRPLLPKRSPSSPLHSGPPPRSDFSRPLRPKFSPSSALDSGPPPRSDFSHPLRPKFSPSSSLDSGPPPRSDFSRPVPPKFNPSSPLDSGPPPRSDLSRPVPKFSPSSPLDSGPPPRSDVSHPPRPKFSPSSPLDSGPPPRSDFSPPVPPKFNPLSPLESGPPPRSDFSPPPRPGFSRPLHPNFSPPSSLDSDPPPRSDSSPSSRSDFSPPLRSDFKSMELPPVSSVPNLTPVSPPKLPPVPVPSVSVPRPKPIVKLKTVAAPELPTSVPSEEIDSQNDRSPIPDKNKASVSIEKSSDTKDLGVKSTRRPFHRDTATKDPLSPALSPSVGHDDHPLQRQTPNDQRYINNISPLNKRLSFDIGDSYKPKEPVVVPKLPLPLFKDEHVSMEKLFETKVKDLRVKTTRRPYHREMSIKDPLWPDLSSPDLSWPNLSPSFVHDDHQLQAPNYQHYIDNISPPKPGSSGTWNFESDRFAKSAEPSFGHFTSFTVNSGAKAAPYLAPSLITIYHIATMLHVLILQ